MAGRVTQLTVEAVIAATSSTVRTTQVVVEAVIAPTSAAVLTTQLVVEAVIAPTSQNLVVSQAGLEVARFGDPNLLVSQAGIEVLRAPDPSEVDLLVSQAGIEVAYENPKGTFALDAAIVITRTFGTKSVFYGYSGAPIVIKQGARGPAVEFVIPGCDLTISGSPITISWDVWQSHFQWAVDKKEIIYIRRDSLAGIAIWSDDPQRDETDAGNNATGRQWHFSGSYTETARSGRYVLSVKPAKGNATLYASEIHFTLSVAGDGPGMTVDAVIAKNQIGEIGPAPTHVQSKGATSPNTSESTLSLTLDSTPTAGHLLVAFGLTRSGSNAFTWPSGWTMVSSEGTEQSGQRRAEIAIKVAGANEPSTIQVDFIAVDARGLSVSEYSGRWNASRALNTGSWWYGSTSTPTVNSITPPAGLPAVLFLAAGYWDDQATISWITGFTERYNSSGASWRGHSHADRILSSAIGSYAGTTMSTNRNTTWKTGIFAFVPELIGTPAFSLKARILKPSGPIAMIDDGTADAVIKGTQLSSVEANATLFVWGLGAFFTYATVLKPTGSSFAVNAVKYEAYGGGFTWADSFKADALIGPHTGSFAADAAVLSPISSSLGLDASISGAISVDAVIYRLIAITWTTPPDAVSIIPTETLAFLTPLLNGSQHFEIQLDTVNSFDGPDLRVLKSHYDLTGWEFWDGGAWQALPQSGMPAIYGGNEARYTIQTPLTGGTWYRRVRAGEI